MHTDYERRLEELAPHEPVGRYRHNLTGEDNADAHLKRQVMGREVVVAVTGVRLDFGPSCFADGSAIPSDPCDGETTGQCTERLAL